MEFGLAAWGFRKTPLEKQLQITSSMNLKLLELSIGEDPTCTLQLPTSPSEIEKVKDLFSRYKIKLLCGSAGNDFTLPEVKENYTQLEKLYKVIDTASELNIKYLRIFAGFSAVEEVKGERWKVLIECLCKAGEYSNNKNVILVIETHGGVEKKSDMECRHYHSVTTKIEVMEKLLSEIPSSVGINFDPANLAAVGIENLEKFYQKFKDRILYMHLKDFAPIQGTQYLKPVACGEGNINWEKLLSVIRDFSGPALIEYENTEDVESGCKRSLDFIYSIMERIK